FKPKRPAAEQRLVENRLFAAIRCLLVVAAQRLRKVMPASDTFGIPGSALAEYRQARAAVFTALVVMGGSGQQIERMLRGPFGAGLMKTLDAGTEVFGIEAHVVTREQYPGAIQRRVFDGLGGRWRGQLLETRQGLSTQTPRPAWWQGAQGGTPEPVIEMRQQWPVGLGQRLPCGLQRLLKEAPILLRAATGLSVGAVHREMHDQLAQRPANRAEGQIASGDIVAGDVQQALGDFLQIAGQRAFQHQAPCLLDFFPEGRWPPTERLPQLA